MYKFILTINYTLRFFNHNIYLPQDEKLQIYILLCIIAITIYNCEIYGSRLGCA